MMFGVLANDSIEMFRSLLPKNFEYEFFDAENEYPAAEGCGEIFPGPYYCFYPVPTINNVENAHEYVQDIIDEEGPFDAVMGFSQVCQVCLGHSLFSLRSRVGVWRRTHMLVCHPLIRRRVLHWQLRSSSDTRRKGRLNQHRSDLQSSSVAAYLTGLTPNKA